MAGTITVKGKIKLTDKQVESMDKELWRSLMTQMMLIDTPKYLYSLGARGNLWVISRTHREDPEVVEVTDEWV